MTNRYLTHFSTIVLAHVLLLLGSWQLAQNDFARESVNLGPTVLNLKLATEIIRPLSLPKTERPKQRPLPKTSEAAPTVEDALPVPASASAPSQKAQADLRAQYKAELRAVIEENKYYPPISRRLGQAGTVIVAFTLLEDGHIIDLRIDSPSRYAPLNKAALDAIRQVHGFRPIPKELGETRMDIKVPLKFFTI